MLVKLISLLMALLLATGAHSSVEKSVFNNVYAAHLWGEEGGGSGPGSSLPATREIVHLLAAFMKKNDLHRLVDAPCGSFHWQHGVLDRLNRAGHTVDYRGFDIVENVIAELQERYAGAVNLSFHVADITADALPVGADILLSRDSLQHLSENNIRAALRNFKAARPTWVVLGGFLGRNSNQDIQDGSSFFFSPMFPPWSLQPEHVSMEVRAQHHACAELSCSLASAGSR